jgi:C4-dicarboxylate-specific signal transduction histidine kinase
VVTRRALLALGGATLLAGCGKDQKPALLSAVDVMRGELTAERALAHDLAGASGLEGRIAARSADRARRLAAAISSQGGDPHEAPEPGSEPDPAAAAGRARAALEAHVTALPSLTGDLRSLGADLVSESAADLALLGAPPDAFPGTPR